MSTHSEIPNTDLEVFKLCLGGNVFGMTADRDESFAVLDAYVAGGGNFVDTADVYGPIGSDVRGVSESVIGEWMQSRGNRDDIVIATKVGMAPGREGLSPQNIATAADESLARLRTDRIDLYYAHQVDPATPLEESLGAFNSLVEAGKVRHIAASNHSAESLTEALAVSEREGLASFVAVQDQYNLVERGYETALRPAVEAGGLAILPYFGLAMGFLTGKYRPGAPKVDSIRADWVTKYIEDPGTQQVLVTLDEIAAAHETTVVAVALAWLAAQPTVAAPLASARTVEQVGDLLAMVSLSLTAAELAALDSVSKP